MIISNVDIDLNSLFNLSYSFDALKLMLGNIGKNQTAMVDKINELDEELKKMKKKNEELEKAVTQNQSITDKKFKSFEVVITNMRKGKDKKAEKTKESKEEKKETKSAKEEVSKKEESKQEEKKTESAPSEEKKETTEVKDVKTEETKKENEMKPLEIPEEENTKKSYNNEAKEEDKEEEKKGEEGKTEEDKDEEEEEDYNYGNENMFLNDNIELEELKKRISDLERKMKNMELMKFSGGSSGSNEELELQKAGLKSLNDKLEEMNENNKKMQAELDEMKVKVNDFNVYDLFKDCKTEGGNIDVAKVLVMNLENKVFKKLNIMDEKMKKNDEDIYKAKNDIVNLKNQNDVNNRAFAGIKEDFKKVIEEIQNSNDSNANLINDLENRLNEKFNKHYKEFDDYRKNVNDQIKDIKEQLKKLKDKVDNNQTIQGPTEGGSSLTGDDLRFLKELNKKTTDLEKNLRTLASSINLEDIKDDIKKLKEEMQLKGSQQDFFDLNDKVNDHAMTISNLKDTNEKLIEDSTKAFSDINYIMKKLESINSALITLKNNEEGGTNSKSNVFDTSRFLEINSFNDFLKVYAKDQDRINRELDDLKRYLDDLAELLKTKASDEDLKNLEGVLNGKIDEIKLLSSKRYADKIDTSKSIKYLDTQIKHII